MKKLFVYLLSFLVLYIFSCGSGDVAFNKKSWNASAFDQRVVDETRKDDGIIWGIGVNLQPRVYKIGDWDMNADNSKQVAHGLGDNWKKVRIINVLIRSDSATNQQEFCTVGGGTATVNNIDISLARLIGGIFDNPGYDSTSFNRGWITIWYAG